MTLATSTALNIVVAHPAEARPIIDAWKLTPHSAHGAQIYSREAVRLIVSGQGTTSAAIAVGVLYGLGGTKRNSPWLNVGVCGHRRTMPGTPIAIQKIEDERTGEAWYPQLDAVPERRIQRDRLLCVQKAETEYGEDCAYDMESAGFIGAAIRYSTLELIHCIKIVSDNREQPPPSDPRKYRQFVEQALPDVTRFAMALGELTGVNKDAPPGLAQIVEHWHFTVTQRNQLANALRQWSVLIPEIPPFGQLANARSARDVLRRLNIVLRRRSMTMDLTA